MERGSLSDGLRGDLIHAFFYLISSMRKLSIAHDYPHFKVLAALLRFNRHNRP